MKRTIPIALGVLGLLLAESPFRTAATAAPAKGWLAWRGPEQNGYSRETGLPDTVDPVGSAGDGAAGDRQQESEHQQKAPTVPKAGHAVSVNRSTGGGNPPTPGPSEFQDRPSNSWTPERSGLK